MLLLGRTFRHEDAGEPVLVLSHEYWQRHLGGADDVVGRLVEMNNRGHAIVGVLPPLPAFPHANDVFMPSTCRPVERRAMRLTRLERQAYEEEIDRRRR